MYSAIVLDIHQNEPEHYEAKPLVDIIDATPIVTSKTLELWKWLSEYYMCTLGEVMITALPSALKMQSETRLVGSPNFEETNLILSHDEAYILEFLVDQKEASLNDVATLLSKKNIWPTINALVEKNLVSLNEEVYDTYKVKEETYVKLEISQEEDEKLTQLFNELEKKAPKQLEILMVLLSHNSSSPIKKSELLKRAKASGTSLKPLIEKNILSEFKAPVSRLPKGESVGEITHLNDEQIKVYQEIKAYFEEKKPTLLYGVTASGKTAIYSELIADALAEKKQSLFLLPEIALTSQMVDRLQKRFGNKVGVFHSKLNSNERVEVWNHTLNGNYQIILGARSALFLPFSNLGIIVVDEEHEISYKQFDPAPRYNARDSAHMLARIHNANIVLGSATPSIESFFNAKTGKYGLSILSKRYGLAKLPEIELVDVNKAQRQNRMNGVFSLDLINAIKSAVENKEQIILLQNRRGFNPFTICKLCSNVTKCVQCDISLTYHKYSARMHCHMCGYTEVPKKICANCGGESLETKGAGTEKIEEDLKKILPELSIQRLDLDSTRRKHGHSEILNEFEEGGIDILVGTQMVTKGLDFGNVSLIGVIDADAIVNYPDFRAFERGFQMITQVSGRAGRRDTIGKVMIQTRNPEHLVLQDVLAKDFDSLYQREISERNSFRYPPFYKIVSLSLKDRDYQKNKNAAIFLSNTLKVKLGNDVLGPETPYTSKIKNKFIQNIQIKINSKKLDLNKVKNFISDSIYETISIDDFKSVRVSIDVDPY